AGAGSAAATPFTPIGIHLECQGSGRTRACPAFLRGFIDASRVLVHAPRAGAKVLLYDNVTQRAGFDRVQLRFTSELVGAPSENEVLQEIDTRAGDDAQ